MFFLLVLCCTLVSASGSLRARGDDTFASRSLLSPGPFTYPSYADVETRLKLLADQHPSLLQVYDAQSKYGLGSPRAQCTRPSGSRGTCKHWVAVLTNRTADSRLTPLADRPHMFLSGNLHGNEWVGPVTIINLLELLLSSATADRTSALYNAWLQRLVNTRTLIAMPITNPAGYDVRDREEDGVDPNRDFPIFRSPRDCMVTVTARAVNEVWRDHLIQTSITFHGGMQSLCYEWGAPEHWGSSHNSESPDDSAQNDIAGAMRAAAGAYREGHYPTGTCNDQVYPVDGGMEDWAYAGSWDPLSGARRGCNPTSNGGYPAEKTVYPDAVLRSFNMLVETAEDKIPAQSTLGSFSTVSELLKVQGEGDGHVPRNIRLALTMLELVEPYVVSTSVRTHAHESGQHSRGGGRPRRALQAAQSSVYKGPGACAGGCPGAIKDGYSAWVALPVPSVPSPGQRQGQGQGQEASPDVAVSVGWDVGGSMHVDATSMIIGTWDPRVPTALFDMGRPVVPDTGLGVDVPDTAFTATLSSQYGLSEGQAADFALYLHAWQRVYRGEAPVSDLMSLGYALNESETASGPTRWTFAGASGGHGGASATYPAGQDIGVELTDRFSACLRVNAGAVDSSASVSLSGLSCDDEDERALSALALPAPLAGASERMLQQEKVVRSLILMPYARVDAAWTRQNSPNPALPPQAHLTNARTNPAWRKENAGYSVRGRYQWAARPVFVAIESVVAADPSPSMTPTSTATSAGASPSNSAPGDPVANASSGASVSSQPSASNSASTTPTANVAHSSAPPTATPSVVPSASSSSTSNSSSTAPPWLIVIPLEMNAGVGVVSLLLITGCILAVISRKSRVSAAGRYQRQSNDNEDGEQPVEEEEDDGTGPTAADVEIVLDDDEEEEASTGAAGEGATMSRARAAQAQKAGSSTPAPSTRPPLGPATGLGTNSKNKGGGGAMSVGKRKPLAQGGGSRGQSEEVEIELGGASLPTAATLAQASPQLRPSNPPSALPAGSRRGEDKPDLVPARKIGGSTAADGWEDDWEDDEDDDADIGRGQAGQTASKLSTGVGVGVGRQGAPNRPTASQLDAQLEAALDELDEQVSDDDRPLTRGGGPAASSNSRSVPFVGANGAPASARPGGKGGAMTLGKKPPKEKE